MSALKPESKKPELIIQNPKSRIQNRYLQSPKARIQDRPGYLEAAKAARYIRTRARITPRVAIILGSGLGGVVDALRQARRIPYQSIPNFPRSTVLGHAGELHVGYWEEVPVAILSGRMHLYEGYSPAQVVLPTRALALAGMKVLLVTCAAGGIAPQAIPGTLMVFSDHLNYQGMNPLVGPEDPRLGPRFIDMSEAYDPQLRRNALQAARKQQIRCFEGVYAGLLGPSFETPAEIRALKRLGADAVGMSTVPEVIAARQLGVRVMAVASITNRAAGLSRQPLSHAEVLEVGQKAADSLIRLLRAVIAHSGARYRYPLIGATGKTSVGRIAGPIRSVRSCPTSRADSILAYNGTLPLAGMGSFQSRRRSKGLRTSFLGSFQKPLPI